MAILFWQCYPTWPLQSSNQTEISASIEGDHMILWHQGCALKLTGGVEICYWWLVRHILFASIIQMFTISLGWPLAYNTRNMLQQCSVCGFLNTLLAEEGGLFKSLFAVDQFGRQRDRYIEAYSTVLGSWCAPSKTQSTTARRTSGMTMTWHGRCLS